MTRFRFFITLAVLLVLASCSSVDEDMRAMIPDDAVGVVKIDMPSLLTKAGMLSSDTVSVPKALRELIDEANGNIVDQVNIFGDLIYNLPSSGIDVSQSSYVYFSPGIFRMVALLPLKDEDATAAMVSRIASGKMTEMSGLLFTSHRDYIYAIDDDILLVGRFTTPVADDVASSAASKIFDKSKPSLLAKSDVVKSVDVENCDVTAYLDVSGMVSVFRDDSRLATVFGDVSALELVADLGIKAMTATLSFDKSKAVVKTDFIFDSKSDYSRLYDLAVAPSRGSGMMVLDALPGELDTYFGLKVKGSSLMGSAQFKAMVEMLEKSSLAGGVNCSEIVGSLDGSLMFGVGKGQLVDYNYAVAAQSADPAMVVDEIVEAASRGGQPPTLLKGEYMYDYGYQGIALGQTGDVVYARCVDFETGCNASLPAFADVMGQSSMVFFKKMMIGNSLEGLLTWGLRNKSHGEGAYTCQSDGENVVISMMKLLCWIEPNANLDDGGDGYDYGF